LEGRVKFTDVEKLKDLTQLAGYSESILMLAFDY